MVADARGSVNVGSESVNGITLLTKGEVVDDQGYGWIKIVKKHITGEIPGGTKFTDEFTEFFSGKSDDEIYKIVQNWVQESLSVTSTQSGSRRIYLYEPLGDGRKMKTIVESAFDSNGDIQSRIITSYPTG